MALWKVNNDIVYAEGALKLNPTEANAASVTRFSYTVPYSNVGKGGIIEAGGKTYHTPSWIEVHPNTTIEDIVVEKKLFDELFVEEKSWEFESASSSKKYTVKLKRDGNPYCNCWGYMAHKKCKHVKKVKENEIN